MRTYVWLIAASLFLICSQAIATSYYVDPVNGNDANNGLSPSAAFKTLQKASNGTQPGDTVYAMAGTYSDPVDSAVLNVTNSGTASAPITYTNYDGQSAIVQLSNSNWEGINVNAGTQYIVINGFEISGTNQSLTWAGANAARWSGLGDPMYNGSGIDCTGTYYSSTGVVTPTAHVTIENCLIHDCAQEGIGTSYSDYITIEHNTIWNCAWYSSYEGSGISTWEDSTVDTNTSIYKFLIDRNIVYNCHNEIGNVLGLPYSITDGNAIIIDGDGSENTGVAYYGKILIANNLAYDCGGRGVNINDAHNVDIVNNTLYRNCQSHSEADTNIDAGGGGAAPYVSDRDFAGGVADKPWSGPVDTSLVTNATPAPLAVYHSERHGSTTAGFTYTIHEKPFSSYMIVLQFTEDHWNTDNKRQFNVAVNGSSWLSNFDIYAAAGAMHKAVAQVCRDTSDDNGDIAIEFTPGQYGVPKVDGIEVLSDYYTPFGEIFYGGPHQWVGDSHCYNNILYPSEGLGAIGDYNYVSGVDSDYNLYYDGSRSNPATPFSDNNALWLNPKFISAGFGATANFHLNSISPAIDSGTSDLAPATDLDGVSRPQGPGYDRGCYERPYSPQYDFETSTQGWTFDGAAIKAVDRSTAEAYHGSHSLAVTFDGPAGTDAALVKGSIDAVAGETITYHVWVPGGSQITSLQPYIVDGAGTPTSTSVPITLLNPNTWNQISVTIPQNAATPLEQIGIQFTTASTWSGTSYLDAVSW